MSGHHRQSDEAARIVGAMHVLRHTHAPEDDGCFGCGVGTSNRANGLGIDAADWRHFFGRKVLDVLAQALETFYSCLDVLRVKQLFFADYIQHRVQERDVAARCERQHVRGVFLQGLTTRVQDDQRLETQQ